MGNLLLLSGPCFRKSKKAGDGLWETEKKTKALCEKNKKNIFGFRMIGMGKIKGCWVNATVVAVLSD